MPRTIALAVFALLFAPLAPAKNTHTYDKGKLLSMDSVSCGYQQKSGKSVASEIIGTDSAQTKTQELLCPEYTIQTDRLIYHVRPKDTKHAMLLPVGDDIELRIQNDKMYLRVPEQGEKEHEYQVISIQMRDDTNSKSSQ